MENFKDKVVVITGGATGIGFALAQQFGRDGAKIVLAANRENRLQEAVAKLAEESIEAHYTTCDVSDLSQVEKLADFAWDTCGKVDVIVNNAGIMVTTAPVVDLPMEEVHRIFDVNFFGAWHGARVFGKRFIEQGTPAAIYNVGSENSHFHGVPMGGAYVATKHALHAMTESLREEMPEFIDVSLICPGFVCTELGDEEAMAHAMPVDEFAELTMTQLRKNEFYVVTHSYNMVRIENRYNEVKTAYDTYVPRQEGDEKYDVRTLAALIAAQMAEQGQ